MAFVGRDFTTLAIPCAHPHLPKYVVKRDGSAVPFEARRIQAAIRRAIVAVDGGPMTEPDNSAWALASEVVFNLGQLHLHDHDRVGVEQIQDIVVDILHKDAARLPPHTHHPLQVWEAYQLYRVSRALVREGRLAEPHFSEVTVDRAAVAAAAAWNERHSCRTIRDLNCWVEGCSGKDLAELVQVAEARRLAELQTLVDQILQARDRLRAIVVCGPSSSGKTSTVRHLQRLLDDRGSDIRFRVLELDNYFKNRDQHPRVSYLVDGNPVCDYNFEMPDAYRIGLINDHLERLLRGEVVDIPIFCFTKGEPLPNGITIRLEDNEILVIDCLHGLSPEITSAIAPENKLLVYLEAMNMLRDNYGVDTRWTDVRLMRRMLRDARTRNHAPNATLWHWHLVRMGEFHILARIGSADVILNTGMPYELPFLKLRLEDTLRCMKPLFENNSSLFDGLVRLNRILELLDQVTAATKAQIDLIPGTSVVREFMGGSVFFGGN